MIGNSKLSFAILHFMPAMFYHPMRDAQMHAMQAMVLMIGIAPLTD
jgi:hypothetical protein